VQLRSDDRVIVKFGHTERRGNGRTLLDYFTFGNLYPACAVLAVSDVPLKENVDFKTGGSSHPGRANRIDALREAADSSARFCPIRAR
jgi:hypothetical protein